MSAEETKVHEPEIVDDTSIELRKPSIPTTINELASLGAKGKAVIEAKKEILQTLRIASIQLTMPNDWVLFRVIDERGDTITGFLSDQGCDRIKKMWGIKIHNLTEPERIESPDGVFAYRITGDGFSETVGEAALNMEGIRYSNERYADEKTEGIQREVAVRKAARANLDGGIVREIAGLKSVPIQELDKCWEGTWKKSAMCAKGRGFGSKDTRLGAADEQTGGVDPADVPICEHCKVKLVFRPAKGDRGAFYGCPNYAKHPQQKVFVDHAELMKQIAERKKLAATEKGGGDVPV